MYGLQSVVRMISKPNGFIRAFLAIICVICDFAGSKVKGFFIEISIDNNRFGNDYENLLHFIWT